ncbi:hypothetical protein RJ641_028335, partial [Dillenia turbinata]
VKIWRLASSTAVQFRVLLPCLLSLLDDSTPRLRLGRARLTAKTKANQRNYQGVRQVGPCEPTKIGLMSSGELLHEKIQKHALQGHHWDSGRIRKGYFLQLLKNLTGKRTGWYQIRMASHPPFPGVKNFDHTEISEFIQKAQENLDPALLEYAWVELLEKNKSARVEELAEMIFASSEPLESYCAHLLLSRDEIYFTVLENKDLRAVYGTRSAIRISPSLFKKLKITWLVTVKNAMLIIFDMVNLLFWIVVKLMVSWSCVGSSSLEYAWIEILEKNKSVRVEELAEITFGSLEPLESYCAHLWLSKHEIYITVLENKDFQAVYGPQSAIQEACKGGRLQEFIQLLTSARAMPLGSKPSKSSWKAETCLNETALQMFCYLHNILKEMGLPRTASAAVNLLIDIG